MHYFNHFEESALQPPSPPYDKHNQGYTQATLVDSTMGSVHTGTHICQLEPQGVLSPHLHAYEKSFYILQGEVVLSIEGRTHRLGPGDFGVLKSGQVHAWRNAGSRPARWFQMAAPQPKSAGAWQDTCFLGNAAVPTRAESLDPENTGDSLLGHFDVMQIPAPDDPARQTSGAPPGVFLKWLVDENLGAAHHRLVFIEYQPGVSLGMHDHTFEECYLILSGEVEVVMDDKHYLARPGDVLWTGVGCFHSFSNTSPKPVCWLETFSPQPPRENMFRFKGEWEKKVREAGSADETGPGLA
ncbi:MAG: cupin domain-containing protein [Steroidobacteraceae bacterium]|nr:cupin domain-containing protein [Steroidobacteraceae bacterium]